MRWPTTTESIGTFLRHQPADHPARELWDRWHSGLETQINVHADGGWQEEGEHGRFYTDGVRGWRPIRIPHDANGQKREPWFNDNPMPWPLSLKADKIGWTGWNWRDRRSEFFVIDLDAAVGHKAGLDPDRLEAAKQAACSLPYVKLRRSKSGNGYHAYIDFANPPSTANHDQHARLAQAVLRKMSTEAGFDFSAAADVVGGNAWFWERQKQGA